jgi:hypothetical protein
VSHCWRQTLVCCEANTFSSQRFEKETIASFRRSGGFRAKTGLGCRIAWAEQTNLTRAARTRSPHLVSLDHDSSSGTGIHRELRSICRARRGVCWRIDSRLRNRGRAGRPPPVFLDEPAELGPRPKTHPTPERLLKAGLTCARERVVGAGYSYADRIYLVPIGALVARFG